MGKENDGLTIECSDGLVSITIGVSTLYEGTKEELGVDFADVKIIDSGALGKAIVREIQSDEGFWGVSKLFERALIGAVESGGDGLDLAALDRAHGPKHNPP